MTETTVPRSWLSSSRLLGFLRSRSSEGFVRPLGHIVFAVAAVAFAVVFWQMADATSSEQVLDLSRLLKICRYFGVAVTFWASLVAAFDFSIQQARFARPWLSGLNLVMLGIAVFLCLVAMDNSDTPLLYTISVHLALLLYLLWDLLAQRYYKQRDASWYRYYESLLVVDIIFFAWYTIGGYLPWIFGQVAASQTQITPEQIGGLSDGFTAAALIFQFLFYWIYSAWYGNKLRSRNGRSILPVDDGYELWAPVYDRGNAVMTVERRHTLQRLESLNLDGDLVDLGAGTGFYTERLLQRARSVVAIDFSRAMLERLEQRVGDRQNLRVCLSVATNLEADVRAGSVDGILCCLLVDHLGDAAYRAALQQISRILRPGGWLYITDVNPYFQLLKEPYAKFIDGEGGIQKIRVYPHSMESVLRYLSGAGLELEQVREVPVDESDVAAWPALAELEGFPLILEYFARKRSSGESPAITP